MSPPVGRRGRSLPLRAHRWSVPGAVFSVLVLAGAVVAGYFGPSWLLSPLPLPVQTPSALAFRLTSAGYFLCWSLRYVPQLYLSWRRGRTVGLSLDGVFLDLVAVGCNLVSTLVDLYYVYPARSTLLHRYAGIDALRLAFSVTCFALCLAVVVQCVVLDGHLSPYFWPSPQPQQQPPPQVVSAGAKASAIVLLLLSCIYLAILLSTNVTMAPRDTVSAYALILSYVYIGFSIVRFAPQLLRNRKHRIVLGYDNCAVALDAVGGACLALSAFFVYGDKTSAAASGLASSRGVPPIVHGGCVFLLASVLLAQQWMYWELPALELRRGIDAYLASGVCADGSSGGGGGGGGEAVPDAAVDAVALALVDFNKPGALTAEEDGWVCCRCTLQNDIAAETCAVCHFAREESLSSDPARWFGGGGTGGGAAEKQMVLA